MNIRRHLSYANVAATLAVVLALSGVAYAAGLPKNSVKSKTIANGQVKSPDLKNDGVKGKDVKESSLARVPDAAALNGIPAQDVPRATPRLEGGFLQGQTFELVVPGYGRFGASCNNNLTPGNATDDLVSYSFHTDQAMGATATQGLRIEASSANLSDAIIRLYGRTAGNGGQFSPEDDRMHAEHLLRKADGSKAIRVDVWGFDDATTTGCYAVVEAQILR